LVLVDTSVWINHLRGREELLIELLLEAQVVTHPFIIGELACGNLKRRQSFLALLQDLPEAESITREEILSFIDFHDLAGKGIGYIDIHLLASAYLARVHLWSIDKKLKKIAFEMNIAFPH
jgi:predicted nucleic acid-binding protein